jgi:hypothetical protein
MLNRTPTPISARRAGRFLCLGVITVVLVTAFAAPSTSAPRFRTEPNITGDQAGRSSQWIAGLRCGKPAPGWGWPRQAARSWPSAGSR